MKTKLKQNNKGVVTVFVVLMNFVGLKTLRESSPNQFCIFKIEGILYTVYRLYNIAAIGSATTRLGSGQFFREGGHLKLVYQIDQ